MLESIFVITLFIIYLLLWAIKRRTLIKNSGIDPQVMQKSESNVQKFMTTLARLLMLYIIVLIPLHGFNLRFQSLLNQFHMLNTLVVDLTGFSIGLIGLSFCLYAQIKMGKSWRVGIDENRKTELITTGLYSLIRNPTYLGMFIFNVGIWMIWPTITVFMFNFVFILFLEIQVRCEEDFLEKTFKEEYLEYKKNTKRYIPFIY